MNTDFNAASLSNASARHFNEPIPQDARPKQKARAFGKYACLNSSCEATFSKWTASLRHIQKDHAPEEGLPETMQQLSLCEKESANLLQQRKIQESGVTSRKKIVTTLADQSLSEYKATWLNGGKNEKIPIAFNHYLLCPQTGCYMITAATHKYNNHMVTVHGKTKETTDYGQGALEAYTYLRQQPWAEVDATITTGMVAKAEEDRSAVREGREARAELKGRKTARYRFVDDS